MIWKPVSRLLATAPLLGFSGGVASSASSQWMDVVKLRQFMATLYRVGQIPTRLECRSYPERKAAFEARVTYQPNKPFRYWHWAWGTRFPGAELEARRYGFKLVSLAEQDHYLGFKNKCGIWHKESSKKSGAKPKL